MEVSVEKRIEVLKKVCQAMGDKKPLLLFGTLLGYVRDGGFIPHDDDIDLGVTGIDEVHDRVCKLGDVWDTRTPSFFQMTIDDVIVCFLEYHKEEGHWRCGDWIMRDHIKKTVEFYECQVEVIENPDGYLSVLYGDWKTPQKGVRATPFIDRSGEGQPTESLTESDLRVFERGYNIIKNTGVLSIQKPITLEMAVICNRFGFLECGETENESIFRNIRC